VSIDFPNSPLFGQEFAVGGVTYLWNGTGWTVKTPSGGTGAVLTVSDVPPVGAADNALWYESDSGLLFIRYNDGTSSQWVAAAPTGGSGGSGGGDFVAKTGDAMTGPLSINSTIDGQLAVGGAAVVSVNLYTGPSGTARLQGIKNGIIRWEISLPNGTAESGSNSGSNFHINRHADNGDYLGTPLLINRANGTVNTGPMVHVNGPTPAGSSVLYLDKQVGGNFNQLLGLTGGIPRWAMYLGDGSTESGADNGSHFYLYACSDAGVPKSPAFMVGNRTNHDAQFNGAMYCNTIHFNVSQPQAQCSYNPGDGVTVFASGGVNGSYIRHAPSGDVWDFVCSHVSQAFWRGQDVAFFHNGQAYKPGGGAWADSSDARIKTVTGEYEAGLHELLMLTPKKFVYKGNDTQTAPAHYVNPLETNPVPRTDPVVVPYENSPHSHAAKTSKEYIGLVAQDAEPIMPELVTRTPGFIDGQAVNDLRVLDPNALTYALINAVKELSARVVALETAAGLR